jgi:hypothetical protein
MNERIKQLAEQARIKDHWSIDEARYLTNYLDEKKFAELIVKECAEVLDETISPPSHPMNSIGYRLKEHFGVAL